MTFGQRQCASRGSALLISLWALLLLSAAVFAWVQFIDQQIQMAGDANRSLEARALAHSGLVIALHPDVNRATPLLKASIGPERGYEATITGEGGKLNLNYLLAGEQPERLALLKTRLAQFGIPLADSSRLVDCLLDWIDPDNIKHVNGAEEEGNYRPPNRGNLLSLDEVEKVKGAEPLVTRANWRDAFTIHTNPGKIDLKFADLEVLQALPGIGEAQARRFLQMRQGPDKIEGTKDDHEFADVSDALNYLGISNPKQVEQLSNLVAIGETTVHILSVGQAGKVYRQVEVVARKVTGTPQILSWKEN
jgi:general secretion pathway protein K